MKLKLISIIFTLFLVSCSERNLMEECEGDGMAEFIPRGKWNGDEWPVDRSIGSKQFYNDLELVFKHYNTEFTRLSDLTFKGDCNVVLSPELTRNFTMKALDELWKEKNIRKK